MAKKAALYARVSTERQEQAGTIESHVAELESYAQEQGYEIDAEIVFLDASKRRAPAVCSYDIKALNGLYQEINQ